MRSHNWNIDRCCRRRRWCSWRVEACATIVNAAQCRLLVGGAPNRTESTEHRGWTSRACQNELLTKSGPTARTFPRKRAQMQIATVRSLNKRCKHPRKCARQLALSRLCAQVGKGCARDSRRGTEDRVLLLPTPVWSSLAHLLPPVHCAPAQLHSTTSRHSHAPLSQHTHTQPAQWSL